MRPHQWIKNILVYVPLVFDRKLTHIPSLIRTSIGFILFCLVASVVYIINDIADLEADRNHPVKRNRPLASGDLPISVAIFTAIVILVIVFPLAYWLAPSFALVLGCYFILNLLYSKWFKHIPIIDVFVLASFYVLRVIAGLTLIDVERFSPWLYVVTTLLALYIGLGKRRAELALEKLGVKRSELELQSEFTPKPAETDLQFYNRVG
ncbi:MAG: UbiA prenyltransferase family protein, partial [Anaerolineales bacterium]|nr:UbiA prenyltransferase family protein [Anaerolineales bacterium]